LKIYHLSADYAKKIKEKHVEVLKENGISGIFIHSIFCTALEILYVADLCYSFLTGWHISYHNSQCYEKCTCARAHTHTLIHSLICLFPQQSATSLLLANKFDEFTMAISFYCLTNFDLLMSVSYLHLNPLPVQFKTLLHGQKGCVFSAGN